MALCFYAVSLIKHLFREKKNNSKPPGPLLNVFPWNHVMLDGLPCDARAPFYYYIKKITSSLSLGKKKRFSWLYTSTHSQTHYPPELNTGIVTDWILHWPTYSHFRTLRQECLKNTFRNGKCNVKSHSYFYCALLAVNRWAGVKKSGTGDMYGLLFGSTALPIFAQAAQETCTPLCAPWQTRGGVLLPPASQGRWDTQTAEGARAEMVRWGWVECVCVCVCVCVCGWVCVGGGVEGQHFI